MKEPVLKTVDFVAYKHYSANKKYNIPKYPQKRTVFVLSGEILFEFSGLPSINAQTNDVVFLPEDKPYKLYCTNGKDWEFIVCMYSVDENSSMPGSVKVLADKGFLKNDFIMAEQLYKTNSAAHSLFGMGLINKCLYELFKTNEKSFKKDGIEKSIDYMYKNYEKKICIKDIADFCGYSASYFKRKFEKKAGIPPMKYVTGIRMEKAKSLLDSGLFSVSETARRCGFDNVYYFSTVFKKHYRTTPSEYKNR